MTAPVGAKQTRKGRKYEGQPSVTTVLNVLGKPGLQWGAAGETALYAIHHAADWQHLDHEVAYQKLRKHHAGVWRDKAQRGTLVHELAQQWAAGTTIDCPPECLPYMDALARFYDEQQPTWAQVERTVLDQDPATGYGGTFDAIADLPEGPHWPIPGRCLLDIKTGKDVYAEVELQLAAYRHAPVMAIYDERRKLIDTEPMPAVDYCAVLHLRGDGTYAFVPVDAGSEQYETFLQARRLWAWWSDANGRKVSSEEGEKA